MTQTSRLIHGNLRLWSDDVALASIVASAGWNTDHLYRRGDIIGVQGRRATRHYAATETLIWSADEELSAWLMNMADHIIQQEYLISQLASRKIEGTVWLALFGDDEQTIPLLSESAVARLTRNNVEILFENYTDFDDEGNPRKTWVSKNACATE